MNRSPEVVWPGRFPVLETPRLVLGAFVTTDLENLFRCLSDPLTVKFVSDPANDPEFLEGVLDEYICGHERGVSLNWAIREKATGDYAGSVSLHEFSFHDLLAETAFDLNRSFVSRGYMTEALGAVLTCGFEMMNLHRVEARVVEGNTRSQRLLERMGFRLEGNLRGSFFLHGYPRNVLLYGRLSTDPV
ncbi:MAG: GNAT family N-acetyltransferase [Candidatus Fermentibacteraceae bacterium]